MNSTVKKRKAVSKFQSLVNDSHAELFRGRCTDVCNLMMVQLKFNRSEVDGWMWRHVIHQVESHVNGGI